MNVNPSPKVRFMSNKSVVEAHRELMQKDALQRAIDFALLEYQSQLGMRVEPQLAATGHFKILGALEFIQIMKTLAESAHVPDLKIVDNLNHKA